MEYLQTFIRSHFARKPVVVSQNVSYFLRVASISSLRKHPFLLALRRWRETSPAAKSEETRMFSQATSIRSAELELLFPITYEFVYAQGFVVSGFSAPVLVLG